MVKEKPETASLEELAERIAGAGLDLVKYRNLSGGIAAIHSAWRV